jgi:hypothetical protein
VEHVEEEAGGGGYKRFVIYPESKIKNYWDYFTLFALFYNVCYVPFYMSFIFHYEGQTTKIGPLDVIDWVSDTIFIVDLFLNFRMAHFVYDKAEKYIVDDSRAMSMQYLKSWFIVDLLAVGIPYVKLEGQSHIVTSLSLFKIFRLVKIVNMLDRITNSLSLVVANIMRMIKIIASFVLFSHLMGCFWYYLGRTGRDQTDPPTGWLIAFADLVNDADGNELPMWDMYTLSLYWAIVSICTTGYGDFYGTTTNERTFITVMLLVGAILYAFLFGNVTVLLQNLDLSQQRFTSRMEVSDEFCKIYSIPGELVHRIRKHLEYTFDLTKGS